MSFTVAKSKATGSSATVAVAFVLLLAGFAQSTQKRDWTLGPFVRPVDAPIIEPNPKPVFTDPITNKPVRWEALHTFNPGAIVRQGKVYVLYRAEDDSGTMAIGMHTSRLGLAVERGRHSLHAAAGSGFLS